VDFTFPSMPPVSDDAKDLMRRIMVSDPAQRLTIAQIQAHPWFQQDLPKGSLEYNDWALAAPSPHLQTAEAVDAVIQAAFDAAKTEREASLGGLLTDEDLLEMLR
jgi:serine/threonine protein kinase